MVIRFKFSFFFQSFIRSSKIKMDSRGVSVKMRLGLDPNDLSKDPTVCEVDPVQMKYHPVRVK